MARISEGKFAPMRTKLLWTALFFLCFMVGRYIPIPLLHGTVAGAADATSASGGTVGGGLLNAANIATGGNFFSPSFFSLGLGPWMGAAILWRFLFIGKITRGRKIPESTVTRARNVLMVILAVVQAISLVSAYQIDSAKAGPLAEYVIPQIVVVAILTVGAIIVAWLAQQNEKLGLGGVTMFILYQTIITAEHNIRTPPSGVDGPDVQLTIWLVVVACVIVALFGIFVGNAEVRFHVNKTSVDNGFTGVSYLPIKLNSAGASPVMYSIVLLAIPQYVASAVIAVVPSAKAGVNAFLDIWGLSRPIGFMVYLVLLFALTIFFGLFTVDPRGTATRMQNGGEYFDRVPPGRATRRYIRGRVATLSAISGVFLVILTGLPMYFIGSHPGLQYLLMAPGTVMVLLGLLWMLREEIADTMIGRKYNFTLVGASSASDSSRTHSSAAPTASADRVTA